MEENPKATKMQMLSNEALTAMVFIALVLNLLIGWKLGGFRGGHIADKQKTKPKKRCDDDEPDDPLFFTGGEP